MADQSDRLERLVAARGEDAVGERLRELDDLEAGLADPAEPLAVLSVLANRTRYRIVQLLVASDRDLAVAELDAVLAASTSAVSHALGELAEVDLVERRRDGKWAYYDATPRAAELLAVLEDG